MLKLEQRQLSPAGEEGSVPFLFQMETEVPKGGVHDHSIHSSLGDAGNVSYQLVEGQGERQSPES